MSPLEFPLLADENIDGEVVEGLRSRGLDVTSVLEEGLQGASDAQVLTHATAAGRVVVTHDRDCGTLAFRSGVPFVGVIYIRPGHISSAWVLRMLDAVAALETSAITPFVLVAERREEQVRIRLRNDVHAV